jgi:hypothetical protein
MNWRPWLRSFYSCLRGLVATVLLENGSDNDSENEWFHGTILSGPGTIPPAKS